MRALILAGGEGKRTRKQFPNLPKGLIRYKNIPIINYIAEQLKDFEVLVNINKTDFASYSSVIPHPFLIEEKRMGNANAIKKFLPELGDKFIIIHCDVICNIDFKALVEAHKGLMTMAVKDLALEKELGLAVINGEKKITGFTRRRYFNCGVYVMSSEVFRYVNENEFQDLDSDLFPKLIKANKLYAFKHNGLWQTLEEYVEKK